MQLKNFQHQNAASGASELWFLSVRRSFSMSNRYSDIQIIFVQILRDDLTIVNLRDLKFDISGSLNVKPYVLKCGLFIFVSCILYLHMHIIFFLR